LTGVPLQVSTDGVSWKPDGSRSTLEQHQLQFSTPSDAAVELCTGGGMRMKPLLLANDPGVLN